MTLGALDKTTLAPKETATATATYTVQQKDVDAGKIVNVVTANAKAVRGTDPEKAEATATVTTVESAADLTVTKTADKKTGVKVGDKITYTITVTNSGNVTVNSLELEEKLEGVTLGALDKTTLAPKETATAKATYTVQQKDVDAGKIENTVNATGKDPKGTEITKPASETVTTEKAAPAIDVTKTSKNANVKVGDTVTYTITVKNTGNVTLSGVAIEDILPGIQLGTLSATTLAPNAEATATATYTVQQKDVDAGQIVNKVTAKGTDPFKTEVTR